MATMTADPLAVNGHPIEIEAVARHRNGVDDSGEPFHVVTFRHRRRAMVGIVFDAPGRVAVFDRRQLAKGDVAFGSNSWRGGDFEPALRHALRRTR